MKIPFSAKSYFVFDILIQVMAFDILPPAQYIDFNFQQTPFWSEEFEWLGYDSSNFVELIGSILLFGGLIILQGIFICLFGKCSSCKKCKSMRSFLNSE